jgi:DNA/RNA endonuclease G (NUC1)
MKKILFLLLLLPTLLFGQTVDTIIKTPIYTSYFSYSVKEPLYVTGTIYKVGGNLPRTGLTFKTGGLKYSATASDYSHNGYDEGHMFTNTDNATEQEVTLPELLLKLNYKNNITNLLK